MPSRVLVRVLAVLVAGGLALSACGSDGSSSDTATPAPVDSASPDGSAPPDGSASPDGSNQYCAVARETTNAPGVEAREGLERQIEVAPEELQAELAVLLANADVLQAGELTAEEFAVIQEPLIRVIGYLGAVCGIAVNITGS